MNAEISRKNLRLQGWVLAGGLVLFGIKWVAWYKTGSNAILTDALESIVNLLAGLMGLYSLQLAARPKDENHPYGHGKIEFVSASIEGTLITVAGALTIYKSIYNIWFPESIQALDLGLGLIAFAGVVNYIMGYSLERQGEKHRSLLLIASGKHLKSDAYSTIGLIIGIGLILLTNYYWLDTLIAIGLGGMLSITGIRILRRSLGGIMDETDEPLLAEFVEILKKARKPTWIDIHNVRIIRYGATLHVDAHVTLPWYMDLKTVHDEVNLIELAFNDGQTHPTEFFIHNDPCHSGSCKICRIPDCKVRVYPQEQDIEWTSESLSRNLNHGAYMMDKSIH